MEQPAQSDQQQPEEEKNDSLQQLLHENDVPMEQPAQSAFGEVEQPVQPPEEQKNQSLPQQQHENQVESPIGNLAPIDNMELNKLKEHLEQEAEADGDQEQVMIIEESP